jgi:hypothetical protein
MSSLAQEIVLTEIEWRVFPPDESERSGGDLVAQGHQEIGEGVFVDEVLALLDHLIELGGEFFEVCDGVVGYMESVSRATIGVVVKLISAGTLSSPFRMSMVHIDICD